MPAYLPFIFLAITVGLIITHVAVPSTRQWVWKIALGLGVLMLLSGVYINLVWTPPEREMGDVYRIYFVHVPHVQTALLALTLNFGCAVAYMFKKSWVADSLAEASAEVGVYLGAVGVSLGAIWGRPTWGVYWTWDPRITTAAILIVVYTGYLIFRKFIVDPEQRATWSSVLAILAFVDIPILWYSVVWWNSLHQPQSTPKTVDPQMAFAYRWGAITFLCLAFVFIYQRYLIAKADREKELASPNDLASGAAT